MLAQADVVRVEADAPDPALHRLEPARRTLAAPSSGRTKYSISICSNSMSRKMKLPGVISLRNALPIWPTPNGSLTREVARMFLYWTKIAWAVSGSQVDLGAASR